MTDLYTFKINGIDCNPIYSDDLKLEYTLQENEYFHNISLNGNLIFIGEDYDYIMSQVFDTKFVIDVYYEGIFYFSGYFARTDCQENIDDKVIIAKLILNNSYEPILNGYDVIHNIIDLKPVLQHIQVDKRPLIQVYVSKSNSVACLLAGSYWTQEVITVDATDTDLQSKYFFLHITNVVDIRVTAQDGASAIYNGIYSGKLEQIVNEPGVYFRGIFKKTNSTDYIKAEEITDGANRFWYYVMYHDEVAIYTVIYAATPFSNPSVTLLAETGQVGSLLAIVDLSKVWMRYLTNVKTINDLIANDLPQDDLVQNNFNYRYAIGYNMENIYVSNNFSVEPTEYGRNNEGNYFAPPSNIFGDKFYPICKDRWINSSIWFAFNYLDFIVEEDWRDTYILKDAYELASVIDKLLKQINSSYYFEKDNSQFLYGGSSIKADNTELFLTQKTNVLRGDYDKPAQKAEISLKQILDMLYAVYNCKWHMEGNALHIEHISYYKKGHTYLTTDIIGMDLTAETHIRHYLPYTFQKNNFSYDKESLPENIKYKYSDSTTEVFNGMPINILSNFIEQGKTEESSVGNFNPDVDFMLLNPSNISNEGFALLAATYGPFNNLIDYNDPDFVTNMNLNLDGSLYSLTNYNVSGYIKVDPKDYYVGNFSMLLQLGCWYDESKQFISTFSPINIPIKPPSNAVYVRVSFGVSNFVFVKGFSTEGYILPYLSINIEDVNYLVQNGYLSYYYLIPNYHTYDLPSDEVKINGSSFLGDIMLKKTKNQELWITSLSDPDPTKLVKTTYGNGFIEKMSINLTSRRVDLSLKYDTY